MFAPHNTGIFNVDQTPPSTTATTWRARLPLLIVVSVAIVGAFTLRDYLSFESLRDNREALLALRDAHYLPTALVFMLAYVAIVAFSLPGATAATLTGGFLFGLFPGALFNVVSATLGAVAIFLAVRSGLGAKMASKIDNADGTVKRLIDGLHKNELSVLLTMRLVPVLPFFIANLIPAFLGVRLSRFALTTFFGIIPGGVVYTSVGVGLGEVFARGETPNLGIIFEPQILAPLLGLAGLAMLPSFLKLFKRKGSQA
jgi:uncharacterized membrane protein YdjX (TVP38/TMEM64 family)